VVPSGVPRFFGGADPHAHSGEGDSCGSGNVLSREPVYPCSGHYFLQVVVDVFVVSIFLFETYSGFNYFVIDLPKRFVGGGHVSFCPKILPVPHSLPCHSIID